MSKAFWLVNSNRSLVKRFIKNTRSEDRFFEYMFIDTGKIVDVLGIDPPVMTTRVELKIDKARYVWKMLLAQN